MMKRLLVALFCIATSQTWADDFASYPAIGPSLLDFDTEDGHLSVWKVDDIGPMTGLRTSIKLNRIGSDPRWAPSITLAVIAGDERAQFQFVKKDPRAVAMTIATQLLQDGKVRDFSNFDTTLVLNQKVDMAIDWTDDGGVTFQLNGQRHRVKLAKKVTGLVISNSTCEVEFDDFLLGRAPQGMP
jgi:hypothetical protein